MGRTPIFKCHNRSRFLAPVSFFEHDLLLGHPQWTHRAHTVIRFKMYYNGMVSAFIGTALRPMPKYRTSHNRLPLEPSCFLPPCRRLRAPLEVAPASGQPRGSKRHVRPGSKETVKKAPNARTVMKSKIGARLRLVSLFSQMGC